MTEVPAVATRSPFSKAVLALALCLPEVFAPTASGAQHDAAKPSPPPNAVQPVYFPVGDTGGSLLSAILFSLGEPSLLESSKDPSVRSFRLSIFSPVPTHRIAVRLMIAQDGGGQIISIVGGDKTAEFKKNERSVSAADVDKFLQMVDRAEFYDQQRSISDHGREGSPRLRHGRLGVDARRRTERFVPRRVPVES
jgi:hypothetical protein